MGKIQQTVTGSHPKPPAGFSAPPSSGRLPHDGVRSHRNRTDLIEILAARYPVIRRLAGELSFRIVARRYILSEPPSIPIAPSFGDNFPRFLRDQSNTPSFEHVADIAEL